VELVPKICSHFSVSLRIYSYDFGFREYFALNNGLPNIGVGIFRVGVLDVKERAGRSHVDLAVAVSGRRRRDWTIQRSGCYRIRSDEAAVKKR
jgi:hypothetical protein